MAISQKVVFDAGMLILLLQEGARAPVDPETKEPINRATERIEFLRNKLIDLHVKIVILTADLAEFLVGAGDSLPKFVDTFDSDSHIEVAPFSQKAAIDSAILTQDAANKPEKKGSLDNSRQGVKVDRQIV